MLELNAVGVNQNTFMDDMQELHPELADLHEDVYTYMDRTKRQVAPYQASAIYHLAKQYDSLSHGARALEIGTALGFSLYFICRALPFAKRVVSLNPKMIEYHWGVQQAFQFPYAQVVAMMSWDYLKIYNRCPAPLDFIFVDGDHNQVVRDIPWFNHLATGGLILFHDYSPVGSKRPCGPVYDALNVMAGKLGRPFDVKVIDYQSVGMVGFYRREGEVYEP